MIGGLYFYFTFTFTLYTPAVLALEAIYQIVWITIQGPVAGAICKHPALTTRARSVPATVLRGPGRSGAGPQHQH